MVIENLEYWQAQVEEWKKSKLTKAEFARRNNIGKGKFQYWTSKIEQEKSKPIQKSPSGASFIDVTNQINQKYKPRSPSAINSQQPTIRLTSVDGSVLEVFL